MINTLKRYLYLGHRWLGIVLCGFMALWFFSGVVMLYVGYPKLTPQERLAALPVLTAVNGSVDYAFALSATGQTHPPDTTRLTTVGQSLRYIFGFGKKQVAVNAETGTVITEVSPADALGAAAQYRVASSVYHGSLDEDAWTHSRALDPHRPLHRVELADDDNTWLYISGTTGEVVRDASRTERRWNWVGAWLHWLYMFRGNLFQPYAANIVIYSALGGTFLALTGCVIGILRWRFSRHYKSGSRSPYRRKTQRWHHITGLVFGLTTFTWILSGLFSVNPWKIFESSSEINAKAYKGDYQKTAFTTPLSSVLTAFTAAGFQPVEIEWQRINGQGYYVAYDGRNYTKIVPATGNASAFDQFDWQQLETAAAQLFSNNQIVDKTLIEHYDYYYYARSQHSMSGHVDKRLPIMRLVFNDPMNTWIQIDPYTGNFTKLDTYKRTSRFLFNLLHSWDWLTFLNNRPLWDVLIILFSAGGFALSITGALMGFRRLTRTQATSKTPSPT